MIVLTLLGGLGSGLLAVASCQTPLQASYEVTMAAEPVTTATNFSLADIAALARGSSGKAGHPPVGFYVSTFGYSIDVFQGTLSGQCPEQVAVHVSMSISGRHIEIGHELAPKKCVYSAFLGHHRKHADDDVSVVKRYQKKVQSTLWERPPRLLSVQHAVTPVDRAEIVRITAETVNTALQGLSEERATAAKRVDTPDEVKRLIDACANRA